MSINISQNSIWSLYFNITQGCNNACSFCASNSPKQKNGCVPTETICKSFRTYSESSISQIVINGGEPTTHPGFKQIIRCAVETKARVVLFTNGRYFSNKKNLVGMDIQKLHRISIPIYGAIDEDHDRLVGQKGAWHQTKLGLHNLDALRDSDLGPTELELKLLAIRPSLTSWPDIVNFISKLIKPPERVVLSGLILSDTLLSHREELIPAMKEFSIPINDAIRRLRALKIKLILLWSIPWCVLDEDNLNYFLERTRQIRQNEAQSSVKEIYFDYRYPEGIELTPAEKSTSGSDLSECLTCTLLAQCGGMPAFLMLQQQSENVFPLSNCQ